MLICYLTFNPILGGWLIVRIHVKRVNEVPNKEMDVGDTPKPQADDQILENFHPFSCEFNRTPRLLTRFCFHCLGASPMGTHLKPEHHENIKIVSLIY